MKRLGSVEIHGLLLVIALAAAWMTWTADTPTPVSADEIGLWSYDTSDIRRVTFKTPASSVTLTPRTREDGSRYLWASTQRERVAPETKKSDKDQSTTAEKPAASTKTNTVVTKEFLGNDKANTLMKSLAELKAKRSLGIPAQDELAELKLKPAELSVRIETKDTTQVLDVGMAAYGGGLRYVRDPVSQTVYVIDSKLIDDLRFADSRLVERSLVPFTQDAVLSISIRSRGKNNAWSGELIEAVHTWLGKLFRLKISKYVGDKESEKKGLTTIFTASLQSKEGQQCVLELLKSGEGKQANYFVRSDMVGRLVSVSRHLADELERDLDGIIP